MARADAHVMSSFWPYWWRIMRRVILTAQTLVGLLASRNAWIGMKRREAGAAYVRPTVKIPVRTSFCD